jgi:Transposase domain (DUF772)
VCPSALRDKAILVSAPCQHHRLGSLGCRLVKIPQRRPGRVVRWADRDGTITAKIVRATPPLDRAALARAFVAKVVLGLPTTAMLIERLKVDKQLRRLCGWEHLGELPSEATFSRAFAEFAQSQLPVRVHEVPIKRSHEERLVALSRAMPPRSRPAKSR